MTLLNSTCYRPAQAQFITNFPQLLRPVIPYSLKWHISFQHLLSQSSPPFSTHTLHPKIWHLALYLLFWTSWHWKSAHLNSACHQIANKLGICILRGSRKWHHNYPKFHITSVESIPGKKQEMTLNTNIPKSMLMGRMCSQLRKPEFHKSSAKRSLERGELSIQKPPFGQNLRDSAPFPLWVSLQILGILFKNLLNAHPLKKKQNGKSLSNSWYPWP